jgi:hypothetical protein
MAEGKLPNLARLAREGTFKPLGTTNPPESPVAWASFATGLNPGGTGIYDFLKRDPETYLPELALVSRERPKFLWGTDSHQGAESDEPAQRRALLQGGGRRGLQNHRHSHAAGVSTHGDSGRKVVVRPGRPDLRGTWGTFFYFSSDLTSWDTGDTEFGGKLVRLELSGNHAATTIEGPVDPTSDKLTRLSVPIDFKVSPDGKR